MAYSYRTLSEYYIESPLDMPGYIVFILYFEGGGKIRRTFQLTGGTKRIKSWLICCTNKILANEILDKTKHIYKDTVDIEELPDKNVPIKNYNPDAADLILEKTEADAF